MHDPYCNRDPEREGLESGGARGQAPAGWYSEDVQSFITSQLATMADAERIERRRADRRLAVDEAYLTLNEYKIKRRRVAFIANDEKREGSFGIVRQAHLRTASSFSSWMGLGGQPLVVAVKEITLPRSCDVSDLKRAFTKEVLVWSRLKGHPGVAKFLGFYANFDRKEAWLISSWEPYGNVRQFIKARKLEVPEKLSLAHDTIDALKFLHELDPPVCHGDIKSPNVLVNAECRALLCDFGLARLYNDSGFGGLESTGMTKGSIRWCSPEILDGGPRTASSDIYAWAWLVWEIMTGELPYEEVKADYAVMRKIFGGPLPHVNGESRLNECLQLWELMGRCWLADVRERPTSAMCKTTFEYLPHCPPAPGTADPHTRSAALLESLGDLESWKGGHEKAFAYLEQAQRLYEKEGNDKGIASVLLKQAAAANRNSNPVKMMNAASAALEKCRNLKDDVGVADALYWIGAAESNTMDAIQNLQGSLRIFRATGNGVGVAKCLRRLGDAYRQAGQAEKVLPTLEEAVDVASRCGDKIGEANALSILGAVHWGLNHLDLAASTFQRARHIAQSIGWDHELSTCLCRLGSIKVEQGIYAEAQELLLESVRVARGSDAGWRLGQALRRLGMCFRAQSLHEEAISALEESCSVYQDLALDFDNELADAAALLADSKSACGYKEDALVWYDKAITEYRKGGDSYEDEVAECLQAKYTIFADMNRSERPGVSN